MAAVTTTKSGVWTDPTVWTGGAGVPTTADDVTILNTHTVTLDTTAAVALTVTINSGGKLAASTSVSSKLTSQRNLRVLLGGVYEALLSALPAITHELRLYAAGSGGTAGSGMEALWGQAGSTVNLQAYERKRWTRLKTTVAAGAASFVVDDATNWRVGDRLIFMAETAMGAGGTDEQVLITSITPGAGTEATIAFTNASAGIVTLLAHTAGIPVANFSSNIIVGPNTANVGGYVRLDGTTAGASIFRLRHVLLDRTGAGLGASERTLWINVTGAPTAGSLIDLTGMASYKSTYNMGYWDGQPWPTTLGPWSLDDIVNWSDVGVGQMLRWSTTPPVPQTVNRWLQMRGNSAGNIAAENTASSYKTVTFNDCHYALIASLFAPYADVTMNNCDFWSCQYVAYNAGTVNGRMTLNNCRVGGVYGAATNTTNESPRMSAFGAYLEANNTTWNGNAQATSWTFSTAGESGRGIARSGGGVATNNRIYTDGGGIDSDTTLTRNSPTSAKCTNRIYFQAPSDARIVHKYTVAVPPNTPTKIKFAAQIDSNYTGTSYPYVRAVLDSVELDRWTKNSTPNVWEEGSITFSHASTSTRLVTIEFAGDPANKTTSNFWFSGMPFDPCIAAARWYGYEFNDASPVVTVDPYTVATEAAAIALTGAAFNYGTKRVTFSAGNIDTFQELYDWGQAYGVSSASFNGMGYHAMPWSRAGAALLLSSGWVVVDPTITGMTWSGTAAEKVEFNSPGAKLGSFSGVTLDLKAVGNYDFSGATLTNVNLVNSSGSPMDVSVNGTATYTNTGPNITIVAPTVKQQVNIPNVLPDSRVYLYDYATATVLVNQIFPAGGTFTWDDPLTAVVTRNYHLRVALKDGVTAKEIIKEDIGTTGTLATNNVLTYRVNQTDNPTYNTNAIDGDTVTGVTFTDASPDIVTIVAPGGTILHPQIYAAFVAWRYTAAGIDDDVAEIQSPDPANYIYTNMRIKTPVGTDLSVDGGWGRDSVTGKSITLRDTTGGSIGFSADHALVVTVGGGPLSVAQAAELTAAANAGNIAIVGGLVQANAARFNNVELTGTGVAGDKIRAV